MFVEVMQYVKDNGKVLYFMGFVFDGGVYLYYCYLMVFCDVVVDFGLEKIYIYVFIDGWDMDFKSGKGFLKEVLDYVKGKLVQLVFVVGWYYVMDWDKCWECIWIVYDVFVNVKGEVMQDVLAII